MPEARLPSTARGWLVALSVSALTFLIGFVLLDVAGRVVG